MQVVIVSESMEERRQYRTEVLGKGLTCAAKDVTSYADLKLRLSQQPPAELVLVFLVPEASSQGLQAIRTALSFKVPVAAVCPSASPQLIIQATRLGAKFVEIDQFSKDLELVVDELRSTGKVALSRGYCTSVTSALPGCGVTTLASTLAYVWGQTAAGKVALAELGRDTPELALDLGLDVSHSLAHLVRDGALMDTSMLLQAMGPEKYGVRLLACPPGTLTAPTIDAAMARKLVVLLRSAFAFNVLDLGHGLGAGTTEALLLSETVIVVTRVDVPALRLTREYLQAVRTAGVAAEKVWLVGNRYDQSGQLPWRKVQEAMKQEPAMWIPDEPKAVNDALRQGVPLTEAAPRSGVVQRVTELAAKLNVPADRGQ